MQLIRTILGDEQAIFIEGMKSVLSSTSKYLFDIILCCTNSKDLIHALNTYNADLLILDLNLRPLDGIEVIKKIRSENIPIKIMICSSYSDPKIVRSAFKSGADGYFLKNDKIENLLKGIDEVMNRQVYIGNGVRISGMSSLVPNNQKLEDRFTKRHSLTKREVQILKLITQALSNKEIAQELFISDQTVSVHRKNIMRKLGVSNTAGLIKMAYDHSLV